MNNRMLMLSAGLALLESVLVLGFTDRGGIEMAALAICWLCVPAVYWRQRAARMGYSGPY